MSASDFAWRVEGIANARALGGIDLDVYRPPGFARKPELRRTLCDRGYVGSGSQVYVADPEPWETNAKARPC